MSISELLVIFVVAFLVLKPEDLPQIAKKLKDFYSFFTRTKTEIMSCFDLNHQDTVVDDLDQMNFYLEKIANLGRDYEGEYSLNNVKDYYQKIIKDSIKSEIESNKTPSK
jgi:Sec-independent protein translocase protein TatA